MKDNEGAVHAKLFAECRKFKEEYERQHGSSEEIGARLGELKVAIKNLGQLPAELGVPKVLLTSFTRSSVVSRRCYFIFIFRCRRAI